MLSYLKRWLRSLYWCAGSIIVGMMIPALALAQPFPDANPQAPPKADWVSDIVGYVLFVCLGVVFIYTAFSVLKLIQSVRDGNGSPGRHVAGIFLCAIAFIILGDPSSFLNEISRPFK